MVGIVVLVLGQFHYGWGITASTVSVRGRVGCGCNNRSLGFNTERESTTQLHAGRQTYTGMQSTPMHTPFVTMSLRHIMQYTHTHTHTHTPTPTPTHPHAHTHLWIPVMLSSTTPFRYFAVPGYFFSIMWVASPPSSRIYVHTYTQMHTQTYTCTYVHTRTSSTLPSHMTPQCYGTKTRFR